MECYLNPIWTLFEMDKSCIPVAKLSGRTRVLQVADTQWPENFSRCTLHTVSLFPLLRCQIRQCAGAKFWHIETSHEKPPFRNNNAFQQQLASHTAKPCGCWSLKSSKVFVRSLIKHTWGLGPIKVSSFQSDLVVTAGPEARFPKWPKRTGINRDRPDDPDAPKQPTPRFGHLAKPLRLSKKPPSNRKKLVLCRDVEAVGALEPNFDT